MQIIPQESVKQLGRKGAVAVLLVELATAVYLLLMAVDKAAAGNNFTAYLAFLGSVLAFFGAANVGEHAFKKPGDAKPAAGDGA